jgi:hypothetical protein
MKCQSVSGQYPGDPTIYPSRDHEAPVKRSTTRFNRLVLFHINPKRLKNISEVWNRTKNISRRWKNIDKLLLTIKIVKYIRCSEGNAVLPLQMRWNKGSIAERLSQIFSEAVIEA